MHKNTERFERLEEERREYEEMLKINPLLAYSTTQLKAELRRRKRNAD